MESQERYGRRFIEDRKTLNGWEVAYVRSYFDRGKSGKNTNRPEQQVEYVVNTTWWKSNFQDDVEEALEESESDDA